MTQIYDIATDPQSGVYGLTVSEEGDDFAEIMEVFLSMEDAEEALAAVFYRGDE